ncbi:MAG: hypothetical protein AB7O97_13825 [Planctomycetota bacterium]
MTAPRPTDGRPTAAQHGPIKGVLRRDHVRLVAQPAVIDCAGSDQGTPMTVVPLMDGDRVAGLEVRCGCGASTLIECIYQAEDLS